MNKHPKYLVDNYINTFDNNINKLVNKFLSSHQDYFFTEKDLHAYFYHLCLDSKVFNTEDGFSLIHTEYPTPFKCKKDKNNLIDYAFNEKDKMRAHIDLVLLNPNYVDWIYTNNKHPKFITGLTNEVFDKYIEEIGEIYKEFQDKYKETILLYALEFKYIRHSYSGTKYPYQEISYDVKKLNLLKNVDFKKGGKIHFCSHILSLVFVGHRISSNFIKDSIIYPDCRIIHNNNNNNTT